MRLQAERLPRRSAHAGSGWLVKVACASVLSLDPASQALPLLATFIRADSEVDTGVALTAVGGEHDRPFLVAWRKLRSDPQLLTEYNALKEAHDRATDEGLYRAAKCAFFDRLV
jgi:GrpB-like predicted nucleotidyltransferase (UPF0157 family)